MDFSKFVEWAFYGVVGYAAIAVVQLLSMLKKEIAELNSKIAIIIEKTAWHEKWLEKHDDEISKLRIGN